jgi:hypothetical protein
LGAKSLPDRVTAVPVGPEVGFMLTIALVAASDGVRVSPTERPKVVEMSRDATREVAPKRRARNPLKALITGVTTTLEINWIVILKVLVIV